MKRMFLIIVAVMSVTCAREQQIEPIKNQIGKLSISVDPRIEVLNSIQVLANYPLSKNPTTYTESISEFFSPLVNHDAVNITQDLLQNHGFSYDAPVQFMLTLSQPNELSQQIPLTDYLTGRAGGCDNLEKYRLAIKDFAIAGNFMEFWKQNIPDYIKMVDLTTSEIEGVDWIDALERYYNDSQNSYNIIIFPIANSHGYASKTEAENGKYDLFATLSASESKEGIPYISKDVLTIFIWHEFGHSFVNDEVSKYPDRLAVTSALFDPIKNIMRTYAYPDWQVCVNEHIVRAVNMRLVDIHMGTDEYLEMLNNDLGLKFIYLEPILDKLKEFEKLRDSQGITFAQYMPTLLDVFDELLNTDYKNHPALAFSGPMNKVANTKNLAIIYPTNGSDTSALSAVKQYAKGILDVMNAQPHGQERLFISDVEAIEKDLSEYAIVTYGTLESNLFLSKYKSTFPFRVGNNILYADKEYSDNGVKFITCLPNPQNEEFGMIIHTALSNNYIIGINDVDLSNGSTDYIVADKNNRIINKGFYKKNGVWRF